MSTPPIEANNFSVFSLQVFAAFAIVKLSGGERPPAFSVFSNLESKMSFSIRTNQIDTLPNVAKSIIAQIAKSGGVTLDERNEPIPSRGYLVSLSVRGEVFDSDELTERHVLAFLARNETKRGQYWGAWLDAGTSKVHLDVSIWFADKSTALRVGKRERQITIWDLSRGEAIGVPANTTPSRYATLHDHSVGDIYPWSIVGKGNTLAAWNLITGERLAAFDYIPNTPPESFGCFAFAHRNATASIANHEREHATA
jgi:hypothetical protein